MSVRMQDQRHRLSNTIQAAIENEASTWGKTEEEFYSPSAGQTWSHVAHRITKVVMDQFDGGVFLPPLPGFGNEA